MTSRRTKERVAERQRAKVLAEYVSRVEGRGQFMACNVPFMSDENWKDGVEIVHQRGPLEGMEAILYRQKYFDFSRRHFLDLMFELELAYTAIAALSRKRRK